MDQANGWPINGKIVPIPVTIKREITPTELFFLNE